MPDGVERHALLVDPVRVVLPAGHPAAARDPVAIPLPELAGAAWVTSHPGMTWERVTFRACRQHGGFEPDIRHRANDAELALALVARGRAVTLLPDLVLPGPRPEAVTVRSIDGAALTRTIYAAVRTTDAARPSTRAVLAAIRDAVSAVA
jgi:DNA-binding transcriptional LysR family regulator